MHNVDARIKYKVPYHASLENWAVMVQLKQVGEKLINEKYDKAPFLHTKVLLEIYVKMI